MLTKVLQDFDILCVSVVGFVLNSCPCNEMPFIMA